MTRIDIHLKARQFAAWPSFFGLALELVGKRQVPRNKETSRELIKGGQSALDFFALGQIQQNVEVEQISPRSPLCRQATNVVLQSVPDADVGAAINAAAMTDPPKGLAQDINRPPGPGHSAINQSGPLSSGPICGEVSPPHDQQEPWMRLGCRQRACRLAREMGELVHKPAIRKSPSLRERNEIVSAAHGWFLLQVD